MNVVLNRTVVVDSDWRFDNLCGSHLQSQSDYCTGCRNVSHCQQQQSYSGLHSPGRTNSTYFWNDSWVQTFHNYVIGAHHTVLCTKVQLLFRRITTDFTSRAFPLSNARVANSSLSFFSANSLALFSSFSEADILHFSSACLCCSVSKT